MKTRLIKSVRSSTEKSSQLPMLNSQCKSPPRLAAAWVTMNPMRKPTPVVLITPITMPTAAEAAPTANAYLTPGFERVGHLPYRDRFCGFNVARIAPAIRIMPTCSDQSPPPMYFQMTKAMKAAA